MQPKSNSAIDTAKGNTQLPVRSTIKPKASGDTIAATADPVFISPEPVPAYCGAMSIGIDHIGPITSSRQKNPLARKRASNVKLAVVNTRPRGFARPPREPLSAAAMLAARPSIFRICSLGMPAVPNCSSNLDGLVSASRGWNAGFPGAPGNCHLVLHVFGEQTGEGASLTAG
jgi:hypothetical protein